MKNNPLVYLFRKMLHYSPDKRSVITFWTIYIVAQTLDTVGAPLIWAYTLNFIQKHGITPDNIVFILALLVLPFIVDLVFWSLHGPSRVKERENAFLIKVGYTGFLLRGLMVLPMEWHTDHHSGETIDKVSKGTNSLSDFAEESFGFIYSLVQLAISYIMLVIYAGWIAAVVVLGMMMISAWITIRFDKILVKQYKELNHAENKIAEMVNDSLKNITTVIILRVEKLVYDSIMKKMEAPYKLFQNNARLSEMKWFLTNICATIMTMLVLATYCLRHIGSQPASIMASMLILYMYAGKVGNLFFSFTRDYSDVFKKRARISNAEELSDDFRKESFANHILPRGWRTIEANHVNFSYDEENDGYLNLDNVSVSWDKGQRIAFIGETGSGKTTLLKIIRDLYHPSTIELRVDGKRLSEGFSGVSRAISLVPQNADIFKSTILENIRLGADYDIDFVRKFTDMACFTHVVESLPNKFDSSVHEKGVNLSGGEQQRLALARGLLACHNKDVVLLDEPTSSLDTSTEMTVYQNIFREFTGKTVISSVHRLHLLPLFDKIYFFLGGRIIASGTLPELLTSSPEFQSVWLKYQTLQDSKSPA